MKHNKVPNYSKWIKNLKAKRIIAACVCGIFIFALAFAAYLVWNDTEMPFSRSLLLFIVFAVIIFGGLMYKNISEAVSTFRIAREGNYACMLSNRQVAEIGEQQGKRNSVFYLTAFSVVAGSELMFLTVMYGISGEVIYLIFAGLVFLIGIVLVLAFSLYHSARLGIRNTFCTVSGSGILVSGEVIPFNTGDVIALLKFSDYYLLRYYRYEIFNIRHKSEIIFPVDGVVRDGIDRPADEEIVGALGLTGLFATDGPWYESRDYGEKDSLYLSEAAEGE